MAERYTTLPFLLDVLFQLFFFTLCTAFQNMFLICVGLVFYRPLTLGDGKFLRRNWPVWVVVLWSPPAKVSGQKKQKKQERQQKKKAEAEMGGRGERGRGRVEKHLFNV